MEKSIVLVGFMAVGKSEVGKVLAKKLKLPFVDTDVLIETDAKSTVNKLFQEYGEDYFRKLESRLIRKLLDQEPMVIAVGGGLPCFDNNMELICNKSIGVHLILGVDKLTDRLNHDKSRPLLKGLKKTQLRKWIKDKLSQRNTYYSKCQLRVRATNSPGSIADRIIDKLKYRKATK